MLYVIQVCWHLASRIRTNQPLLCVQCKAPYDGQRNCPKHVDFYSKNKFEKFMHLVGFILLSHSTAGSYFTMNCRSISLNCTLLTSLKKPPLDVILRYLSPLLNPNFISTWFLLILISHTRISVLNCLFLFRSQLKFVTHSSLAMLVM